MKVLKTIKFSEAKKLIEHKHLYDWILIIEDKDFDNYKTLSEFQVSLNPKIGAIYYDYNRKSTGKKLHRYTHLLLSEEFQLNHLVIRSDFIDLLDKNLFQTMLNIYNRSIILHVPEIGFEFE